MTVLCLCFTCCNPTAPQPAHSTWGSPGQAARNVSWERKGGNTPGNVPYPDPALRCEGAGEQLLPREHPDTQSSTDWFLSLFNFFGQGEDLSGNSVRFLEQLTEHSLF